MNNELENLIKDFIIAVAYNIKFVDFETIVEENNNLDDIDTLIEYLEVNYGDVLNNNIYNGVLINVYRDRLSCIHKSNYVHYTF